MKSAIGSSIPLGETLRPETNAVDFVETNVKAMLPRMVTGAILRQYPFAIRRDDWMNIGAFIRLCMLRDNGDALSCSEHLNTIA